MIEPREESLLKALIENAIDGVIMIDSMGIIKQLNSAALKLFGYERDELIDRNVNKLMASPHSEKHDEYIKRYTETGVKHIIGIGREVEGLKKDGSLFPFDLAISELKHNDEHWFVGFIHDLTVIKESERRLKNYASSLENHVKKRTEELHSSNQRLHEEIEQRKKVEEALLESQELYKAIARNFPNGTINVIDTDFNYLFVDGKGLRDRGLDKTALIGTSYLDTIEIAFQTEVQEDLDLVLKGDYRVFEIRHGESYFILRAVPLHDKSGAVSEILLVETNITSQKNAEEEIYRTLKKEKELNELKSRFVSMASHEFRTPLSTILSSATLIEKYEDTLEHVKRLKHVDRIKSNVNNLNMILEDFISLEKLNDGILQTKKGPVRLVPFIREITDEMEGNLKTGQKFKLNIEDENIELVTDGHVLKNVMNNLISNASKYSDTGKDITISISNHHSQVQIGVKDQGIGIPVSESHQIFSRFFRASNAGNISGTGLGLHIVKKYIELLGARINFESVLGEGTTFIVLFEK
jgi:PAS domain S-box-containing protein